jgi:hypothetical protein
VAVYTVQSPSVRHVSPTHCLLPPIGLPGRVQRDKMPRLIPCSKPFQLFPSEEVRHEALLCPNSGMRIDPGGARHREDAGAVHYGRGLQYLKPLGGKRGSQPSVPRSDSDIIGDNAPSPNPRVWKAVPDPHYRITRVIHCEDEMSSRTEYPGKLPESLQDAADRSEMIQGGIRDDEIELAVGERKPAHIRAAGPECRMIPCGRRSSLMRNIDPGYKDGPGLHGREQTGADGFVEKVGLQRAFKPALPEPPVQQPGVQRVTVSAPESPGSIFPLLA